MNKTIRLTAATAACVLFAFLPAKGVKADELLITSYQELSAPDSGLIKSEEILSFDEPLLKEDVLIANDSPIVERDILLGNDIGNNTGFRSYDNSNDEILLTDVSNMNGYDSNVLIIEDIERTYNRNTDDTLVVETGAVRTDTSVNSNVTHINKERNDKETDVQASDKSKTVSAPDSGKTRTVTKVKTSADNKTRATVSNEAASSETSTDIRQKMLDEINKKRAKAGVCRLTLNNDLNKVAQKRVNEVTKRFAHTRADGRYWVTILSENGIDYDYAGENLARYLSTPEQVVNSWSCSPSHNRCMLNGDYTQAGIGTVTVNGCTYWTLTLTD